MVSVRLSVPLGCCGGSEIAIDCRTAGAAAARTHSTARSSTVLQQHGATARRAAARGRNSSTVPQQHGAAAAARRCSSSTVPKQHGAAAAARCRSSTAPQQEMRVVPRLQLA